MLVQNQAFLCHRFTLLVYIFLHTTLPLVLIRLNPSFCFTMLHQPNHANQV